MKTANKIFNKHMTLRTGNIDYMSRSAFHRAMKEYEKRPTLSHREVMKAIKLIYPIRNDFDGTLELQNKDVAVEAICQLAPKQVSDNRIVIRTAIRDLRRHSKAVKSEIVEKVIADLYKEYERITYSSSEPKEPSQWISVKDRLPERECPDEAIPVLVSIGEVGPVYEAVYDGNGEFCRSIYDDYPADITHWMPLPLPPAPEQEEGGEK